MSEMTIIPDLYLEGNSKQWKIPNKHGRVWHKADFDFIDGYRNSKRILYSNDGLIFVSYDHAQTFYELVK